jgi:hypothetical protein
VNGAEYLVTEAAWHIYGAGHGAAEIAALGEVPSKQSVDRKWIQLMTSCRLNESKIAKYATSPAFQVRCSVPPQSA